MGFRKDSATVPGRLNGSRSPAILSGSHLSYRFPFPTYGLPDMPTTTQTEARSQAWSSIGTGGNGAYRRARSVRRRNPISWARLRIGNLGGRHSLDSVNPYPTPVVEQWTGLRWRTVFAASWNGSLFSLSAGGQAGVWVAGERVINIHSFHPDSRPWRCTGMDAHGHASSTSAVER